MITIDYMDTLSFCDCCGRYNKETPWIKEELCKNIIACNLIDGRNIHRFKLCEDCARQLRNQLNEILDEE